MNNPLVAYFFFFSPFIVKLCIFIFFLFINLEFSIFLMTILFLQFFAKNDTKRQKSTSVYIHRLVQAAPGFLFFQSFFFKKNAIRPTLLPYTDLNQKFLPQVKPRLWNPPQRAWSFFSTHQTKKWPAYQRNSRTTPKQRHFSRTAASAAMRLEWQALLTQNLPHRSFSISPKRKLPHHLQ